MALIGPGATLMDVPMTWERFREFGFHPDAPVHAALEHLVGNHADRPHPPPLTHGRRERSVPAAPAGSLPPPSHFPGMAKIASSRLPFTSIVSKEMTCGPMGELTSTENGTTRPWTSL